MAGETPAPISAAKPPVSNPMVSATVANASTLKLKPVIRKPTIGGAAGAVRPGVRLPSAGLKPVKPGVPAAPAPAPAAAVESAPTAVDQLKDMTQKLKGITQQIPAQAILHKTGIIADQNLTEAQKQASKSRTARISLSDAMGVAPVKNEAAPMKTIRIKRPVDIQKPVSASSAESAPTPAPAAAPKAVVAEPVKEEKPAAAPEAAKAPAAEAPAATITQRKTLKIARPGSGARPGGKLALKKPGAAPASEAKAPAEGDAVADIPDIADIPDLPAVSAPAAGAAEAAPLPKNAIPAVGGVMGALGLLVQIAACLVIGLLGYFLFEEFSLPLWCGGCS